MPRGLLAVVLLLAAGCGQAGQDQPEGDQPGPAAMRVSPAAWWQGFARGVPPVTPGSLNGQ
jgi:hypothetical protein